MKKKHLPWVIILLVLLLDQGVKVLVKTNMTMGQSIPVLGDWFILHFTENYGMAFGMEFAGEYGKLLLSLLRIAAVIFIGYYIRGLIARQAHAGLIACASLIMAGALGNITDSAFYGMLFGASYYNQVAQFLPEGGGYATFLHGKVVDMLYFPIIRGNFPAWFPFWSGQEFIFFRPVFNIADSAITLGVFTLLIFQKRFFTVPPPAPVNLPEGQEPDPAGLDMNDDTADPFSGTTVPLPPPGNKPEEKDQKPAAGNENGQAGP